MFSPVKVRENLLQLGIKQSTSNLVQTLKKNFFLLNFAANSLLFYVFPAFWHTNAENDYLNQRLGCLAPKYWLKYTTTVLRNQFNKGGELKPFLELKIKFIVNRSSRCGFGGKVATKFKHNCHFPSGSNPAWGYLYGENSD